MVNSCLGLGYFVWEMSFEHLSLGNGAEEISMGLSVICCLEAFARGAFNLGNVHLWMFA